MTRKDSEQGEGTVRDFIPVAEPVLGGNELAYVTECIETNWISSIGAYVSRFEEEFAAFIGTEYAATACNGTAALHLALACYDIGPGDEVIIPSLTFASTAFAVSYCGAKPVFVDVEPDTWCMNPAHIEAKLTKNTRAIIPVHLYGHPVDMDPILSIAQEHDLYVVEDAAEAHGAEYKDKRVGALSDVGVFSFYGNKIITTGEGGMLTTNNRDIYERTLYIRDVAMAPTRRYWHNDIGYNYRLTNIQAAIGVAQLEQIDGMIAKKIAIADKYNSLLKNAEGITLPVEKSWARNVFWMYSVLIGDEFGMDRDEVMHELKKQGIDSRPFFYPLHHMPPYLSEEELPVTERISRQGINLPSGNLLSDEEIAKVCDTLKSLNAG